MCKINIQSSNLLICERELFIFLLMTHTQAYVIVCTHRQRKKPLALTNDKLENITFLLHILYFFNKGKNCNFINLK